MCLNTWSLDGGVVCGGCKAIQTSSLAGKHRDIGVNLEGYMLSYSDPNSEEVKKLPCRFLPL